MYKCMNTNILHRNYDYFEFVCSLFKVYIRIFFISTKSLRY